MTKLEKLYSITLNTYIIIPFIIEWDGFLYCNIALRSFFRHTKIVPSLVPSISLATPFHLPSNKGAQRSTKGVIHIHCLFSFYLTFGRACFRSAIIKQVCYCSRLFADFFGSFF